MNLSRIKEFVLKNRITLGIVAVLILLVFSGFSLVGKFNKKQISDVVVPEVDLSFDAEGPYALLYPRKDGNALVMDLKRTASYDSITYELAYTSTADETVVTGNKTQEDGDSAPSGSIDRGVVGTIDTKDKKGEYEQEILFGTCSKNVCKYDKGVENGTLTLHIKKGTEAYKMQTQWHLQKPDVALGALTSGDSHFTFEMDGDRTALILIDYTIINDLTGAPKLPSGKAVLGKVYSLNVPITKEMKTGTVTMELAQNPSSDAKIYRYDSGSNNWKELETKISGSKLTAKSDGAGIFAVLSSQK